MNNEYGKIEELHKDTIPTKSNEDMQAEYGYLFEKLEKPPVSGQL